MADLLDLIEKLSSSNRSAGGQGKFDYQPDTSVLYDVLRVYGELQGSDEDKRRQMINDTNYFSNTVERMFNAHTSDDGTMDSDSIYNLRTKVKDFHDSLVADNPSAMKNLGFELDIWNDELSRQDSLNSQFNEVQSGMASITEQGGNLDLIQNDFLKLSEGTFLEDKDEHLDRVSQLFGLIKGYEEILGNPNNKFSSRKGYQEIENNIKIAQETLKTYTNNLLLSDGQGGNSILKPMHVKALDEYQKYGDDRGVLQIASESEQRYKNRLTGVATTIQDDLTDLSGLVSAWNWEENKDVIQEYMASADTDAKYGMMMNIPGEEGTMLPPQNIKDVEAEIIRLTRGLGVNEKYYKELNKEGRGYYEDYQYSDGAGIDIIDSSSINELGNNFNLTIEGKGGFGSLQEIFNPSKKSSTLSDNLDGAGEGDDELPEDLGGDTPTTINQVIDETTPEFNELEIENKIKDRIGRFLELPEGSPGSSQVKTSYYEKDKRKYKDKPMSEWKKEYDDILSGLSNRESYDMKQLYRLQKQINKLENEKETKYNQKRLSKLYNQYENLEKKIIDSQMQKVKPKTQEQLEAEKNRLNPFYNNPNVKIGRY